MLQNSDFTRLDEGRLCCFAFILRRLRGALVRQEAKTWNAGIRESEMEFFSNALRTDMVRFPPRAALGLQKGSIKF